MKKTLLRVVSWSAVIGAVCFACQKSADSGSSDSSKSKSELLTQASWKYETSGIDLDHNGTIDQNMDSSVESCVKDNIYTFNSDDSTGTMDEGSTKCNSADPQTTPFDWSFGSDSTTISSSASIFNGDTATILKLDDNELWAYINYTYYGQNFRYIFVLKH